MEDDLEELIELISIFVVWVVGSQIIGEWITENYYLIETVSLLLIFGLLHEIWTSSGGLDAFLEIAAALHDAGGRTGSQIILIFGVTSLVISSMMFRNWVEARFGPLAVVQLLAFIMIVSRMFINVRATENILEIWDGTRSTGMIYTVGILAIILSFLLQDTYPPSSTTHNSTVIFLSTILPAIYFYAITDEQDIRSLEEIIRPQR